MRISYIFSILLFVLICTSNSFSQVQWTKFDNPVLLPGSPGEWDDGGFAGHSVLYDSTTGIYKMWYGGSDGVNFRIGYATSTDGFEWTKYDDPSTTDPPYAESDPVLGLGPGSFETDYVYFPIVIFDGTTYHMWYDGHGGNTERVGYATSADGIVWIKDTAHNPVINPGSPGSWDGVSVGPGPVHYDGTTFEMIYSGFDGTLFQAGYATSINGYSWDKSGDIVLPAGSPSSWDYPRTTPSSVEYNPFLSKYYLFYSGGDFGEWKIGYAEADAFQGPWTKHPSPILQGTSGGWDAMTTAFPSVVYFPDDSLYKMWYMGTNNFVPPSGGEIGYADSHVIIPVELTSFTAAANGTEVILYWNTATEINNRGFEIQRSSDGNEFSTIGFVQGNGTTTKPQSYTWSDRNLSSGINFYRLKQVDFDGSYEYSDVVEVEWKAFKSYLLEQNYPNPFNPATTIGYGINEKGVVKITVLNAIGEEVAVLLNEEKEAGYHQVEFNAGALPSGVYFYKLQSGTFVQMKKMILMK